MDNWFAPLVFGIVFTVFALLLFWIRFRIERKDADRSKPNRRNDHGAQ